ncbi:unnamed protein product [Cuscuta campestris]|uniref:Uncharacterized protein n=1 Tax=Cuscuta campestris TaxID=132261 RepID=A0A484NNG3_9ASTE|nr:unnamed protein product [Cuscuta campestris]
MTIVGGRQDLDKGEEFEIPEAEDEGVGDAVPAAVISAAGFADPSTCRGGGGALEDVLQLTKGTDLLIQI